MSLTQLRQAATPAQGPVFRYISSGSVHVWTAEYFDYTVNAVPMQGSDPTAVPCKVRFTLADMDPRLGYGPGARYRVANALVRNALPNHFIPRRDNWFVADNRVEAPF